MPKGYSTYFNYVLYKLDETNFNVDLNSSNIFIKYFRSTQEIADYLGVSRMTIFNVISGKHRSQLHKFYVIEKLSKEEKIKRFEIVKVDDEVLN
jgi:hypothetical protein